MLIRLFLLLILPPVFSAKSACNFQGSVIPKFSSWNLNNILTWNPPEKSKEFQYTVRYFKYGNRHWKKKKECTNITLTLCDLTNETHITGDYIGQVIIKNKTCSQSVKTKKFTPQIDTVIGPPTINLVPGDASIKIKLTHPVQSSSDIYKELEYHIYLNDIKVIETGEPSYEIKNIDPNTEYCISSEVHWFHKKSNLSEKKCIKTNEDRISQQTIEGLIYVLPVVLIFCIVIAIGCAIHSYIYGSNRKQPQILNIATINNNNAISVDAQTVTINLITIEYGKANQQYTIVTGKEKDKEFQNQTDQNIIDCKDQINCDSGVTEVANEKSDDDYGYVSLQEQKATARPNISPYDMPHHLHETVAQLSTSTDIVCEERDLYGHSKSITSVSPVQDNDDLDVVPNEPEKATDNYLYVAQGVSDFVIISRSQEDVCELEESFIGQKLNRVNVIEATGPNESTMLFVDWSPEVPPLYIPNMSKKKELEDCMNQCQEEKEGLLSHLYLPPEVNEAATDNELEQLEKRWGLFIQDAEKT